MDCYVVSDGDIVADFDCGFLIECVEYGSVLDVDSVADAYGVDIASDDGVEPYAAFFSHHDVADDGGVFSKECVTADFGCEAAHGYDECHFIFCGCNV